MSAAVECKAKFGEDLLQLPFFFFTHKTHSLCDLKLFLFTHTVAKLRLFVIQTAYYESPNQFILEGKSKYHIPSFSSISLVYNSLDVM